ncbi:MAG: nucleoside 2-deoxyribosyltransferase [Anaerolineae bacterium]|nr:nucleoside 2-deoxyribosyltransferase [Anaerolineae bacterium]
MNIYFSCSITGGRNEQQIYEVIVQHLLSLGAIVPTASLADINVLEEEKVVGPVDVFERDTQWVLACDAVIAEVSTPSHGVGYEIALALDSGKPVLCCYQSGKTVSKMITGNTRNNIRVITYASVEELLEQIDRFLEDFLK